MNRGLFYPPRSPYPHSKLAKTISCLWSTLGLNFDSAAAAAAAQFSVANGDNFWE